MSWRILFLISVFFECSIYAVSVLWLLCHLVAYIHFFYHHLYCDHSSTIKSGGFLQINVYCSLNNQNSFWFFLTLVLRIYCRSYFSVWCITPESNYCYLIRRLCCLIIRHLFKLCYFQFCIRIFIIYSFSVPSMSSVISYIWVLDLFC